MIKFVIRLQVCVHRDFYILLRQKYVVQLEILKLTVKWSQDQDIIYISYQVYDFGWFFNK